MPRWKRRPWPYDWPRTIPIPPNSWPPSSRTQGTRIAWSRWRRRWPHASPTGRILATTKPRSSFCEGAPKRRSPPFKAWSRDIPITPAPRICWVRRVPLLDERSVRYRHSRHRCRRIPVTRRRTSTLASFTCSPPIRSWLRVTSWRRYRSTVNPKLRAQASRKHAVHSEIHDDGYEFKDLKRVSRSNIDPAMYSCYSCADMCTAHDKRACHAIAAKRRRRTLSRYVYCSAVETEDRMSLVRLLGFT